MPTPIGINWKAIWKGGVWKAIWQQVRVPTPVGAVLLGDATLTTPGGGTFALSTPGANEMTLTTPGGFTATLTTAS